MMPDNHDDRQDQDDHDNRDLHQDHVDPTTTTTLKQAPRRPGPARPPTTITDHHLDEHEDKDRTTRTQDREQPRDDHPDRDHGLLGPAEPPPPEAVQAL